MALIKCKECGDKVSDKASACPHCGAPLRPSPVKVFKEKKKRIGGFAWVVIIIVAIIVLPLFFNMDDESPKPTKIKDSSLVKKETRNKKPSTVFNKKPARKIPFRLLDILDKNAETVQKVLGKPLTYKPENITLQGKKHNANRGIYLDGHVEVVFVQGGGRLITIWLEECAQYKRISENTQSCEKYKPFFGRYSYPQGAYTILRELGLNEKTKPTFSSQVVTKWKYVSGIYEILMFEDGLDGIRYVYVTSSKKYQP